MRARWVIVAAYPYCFEVWPQTWPIFLIFQTCLNSPMTPLLISGFYSSVTIPLTYFQLWVSYVACMCASLCGPIDVKYFKSSNI